MNFNLLLATANLWAAHKFFYYWYFVSHSGKGWPLNYHFVFDLLAVCSIILVVVALLLPKSIELKRIREPKKLSQQQDNKRNDEQVDEESKDSQDSERTPQQSWLCQFMIMNEYLLSWWNYLLEICHKKLQPQNKQKGVVMYDVIIVHVALSARVGHTAVQRWYFNIQKQKKAMSIFRHREGFYMQ